MLGTRKHAINPTLDVAKLAGLGIEITTFDTTVIDDLSPDSLGITFGSNFIGPLPFKQELFDGFSECYRVLRRGGKLLAVRTDNQARLPRELESIDHYIPSTEYSQNEALSINGFRISECTLWFLPFSISSSTSKSSKLLISYLEISSVWRIFSKQTFIGRVKL